MSRLIAGDSYKVEYSHSRYSSDEGWTLTYYLSGAKTTLQQEGESDGDGGWVVTLSASRTSLLSEGLYKESLRVSDGTDSYTVRSRTIRVVPNPATQPPRGAVAERMLRLVEAALENQLSEEEALESISIGGRSIQYMSRAELLAERDYWMRELASATGVSPWKSIPIRANRIF